MTSLEECGLQTEVKARKAEARPPTTNPDQPRASSPINDNYCVLSSQEGLLARNPVTVQRQCKDTFVNLNFHCVNTSYLPDDSYSPAPAGPAKRKKRRPGFHPRQDRYTTLHSPGGLVPASLARGT